MKLTPLADNVLLKSFEAEEKTASGIILSTATKEKSVVSELDGEDYVICKLADILAIVD